MTKKADFNAEEWSRVVEAPLPRRHAGDHHGPRRDDPREPGARTGLRPGARGTRGERAPGRARGEFPALDQERLRAAGDVSRAVSERLGQALAILKQKASAEEVEAYRRFVMNLAETAAKGPQGGRLHRHRRRAGERP